MIRDVLHLMGVYTKTIMKSWFQYKVDAVLRSLAVFLRESTGIIVVYFTLLKFDTLNGWNVYEMLFEDLGLLMEGKRPNRIVNGL